jgi:hypothetical protein
MTTPVNIETLTAADVAATLTPPKASNVGDARFDLAKLRLPQHFSAGAVEKFITTIPIRKPDRFTFIRVHPDEAYHLPTLMFDLKEERETYLVDESLRDDLATDLVAKIIFPVITRQGVLFLWPVRLPDESGKLDNWNRSALEAAQLAMAGWVRVSSNLPLGGYDVIRPKADFPDPVWPGLDLQQMLAIAFKHFFIDSLEHPRLRAIRGEQ